MIRPSPKTIEIELTDKISEVLSKGLGIPVKYDSWICGYAAPSFFRAKYTHFFFWKFHTSWEPIAQIFKNDPLELTTEHDDIAQILDKAGYDVVMDEQYYYYYDCGI